MEDWKKELEDMVNKTSKIVEEGSRDFMNAFDRERRKMEIKAQIGHHERAVTKAYTRLGEAYYKNVETGASMDAVKDVADLIRSNSKVIELLNQQLADMEPEQKKPEDKKPEE